MVEHQRLHPLAAGSGAQLAGADQAAQAALRAFGEKLGIAFQLIDDVLDYQGQESGKTLFADLLEGKLTLPLVLAIEKERGLAEYVARIHAGDDSVVQYVSSRVIDSGACEEVRKRAVTLTTEAQAALSQLPLSGARQMLSLVARELTERVA